MTRTYVHYFGDDQVASIVSAIDELVADWEKRRSHVSSPTREAGDLRIQLAKSAVILLADRVPYE